MTDTAEATQVTTAPAHHSAGLQLIWMGLFVAVLAVAIPAALLVEVGDVGRSQAWLITLVITIWSGVRLSVLMARGRPELFDYFFWLFCYIFMGIGATVQIRADAIADTTPGMDPALDMPTAMIVAAGILCYELGRLVWLWWHHRAEAPVRKPVAVSTSRALILMVAGLALSFYYVYKVGFGSLLSSRDAATAAREAAWDDPASRAVFFALAIYPLLVAVGALWQARQAAAPRTPGRGLLAVIAVIGMLVLLAVANPVATARYTFGTVAFALAVYAGAIRTPNRVRITLSSTLVAFLFLFPIADAFRRVGSPVTITRTGFFSEYLANDDYDAFWQISNAFSYWVDGLVQPGMQFLGSILFWVPRTLWANKPTDTGIMLADYRGYDMDNLSAPAWAELLVNGGVVAVPIGFLLIGAALAALDRLTRRAHFEGGWWALVGAILPVYTTILLRGSLLQATGALVVMLAGMVWVRRSLPRSEFPELPQ